MKKLNDKDNVMSMYKDMTSRDQVKLSDIKGLVVTVDNIPQLARHQNLSIGKRSGNAYDSLSILTNDGEVIVTDKLQATKLNQLLKNLRIDNVIVTDENIYKFTLYSKTPYKRTESERINH